MAKRSNVKAKDEQLAQKRERKVTKEQSLASTRAPSRKGNKPVSKGKKHPQPSAGSKRSRSESTSSSTDEQGANDAAEAVAEQDYDIFVGGLPDAMSDDDIKAYLNEKCKGSVTAILRKIFPPKLKRRSLTLIKLGDDEEAVEAALALSGAEVLGCKIVVSKYTSDGKPRNTKKAKVKGHCFDFQNKGFCSRGESCPFEHVPASADAPRTAKRIGGPCYSFSKTGACKRGDECPFEHDPTVKIGTSQPQNDEDLPQTTLYVGNLPYDTQEEVLRKKLEPFGTIKNLRMVKSKHDDSFTGQAFAEFESEEIAQDAATKLNGKKYKSRPLVANVKGTRQWNPRPAKREHKTHAAASPDDSAVALNIGKKETKAAIEVPAEVKAEKKSNKKSETGRNKNKEDAFVYGSIVGFQGKKVKLQIDDDSD